MNPTCNGAKLDAAPGWFAISKAFIIDPTLIPALRYVADAYPADGPGPTRLTFDANGFRTYNFNHHIALAVNSKTYEVIDLGREIGRRRAWGRTPRSTESGRMRTSPPQAGLSPPTRACGCWKIPASSVASTFGLKNPNVIVTQLRYPERQVDAACFGVAPQDGGQVFMYDVKTRQVWRGRAVSAGSGR